MAWCFICILHMHNTYIYVIHYTISIYILPCGFDNDGLQADTHKQPPTKLSIMYKDLYKFLYISLWMFIVYTCMISLQQCWGMNVSFEEWNMKNIWPRFGKLMSDIWIQDTGFRIIGSILFLYSRPKLNWLIFDIWHINCPAKIQFSDNWYWKPLFRLPTKSEKV